MTGLEFDVFLYKGSEVDDRMANFLIDEVFADQKLILINVEKCADKPTNIFKRRLKINSRFI